MHPLSPEARIIINVVKNLGARMGGYVPRDQFEVLFKDEQNLLRRAMNELKRGGYILKNENGDVA
jgi:hypothetical protein